MNRDERIEEIMKLACTCFEGKCNGCPFGMYPPCPPKASAERIYNKGYRKASKTIKAFIKHFEMYIGNCTFTMGQTNDIQYALKKATEDVLGGENEQR